jgi:hypothetical protein
VITTVIPPVNVGISVALRVILMHLWAVKYSRILYIIFQGGKKKYMHFSTYALSDLHNFKNNKRNLIFNIF